MVFSQYQFTRHAIGALSAQHNLQNRLVLGNLTALIPLLLLSRGILQSSCGIVFVFDDKAGGEYEENAAQHLHKTGGEERILQSLELLHIRVFLRG